MATTIKLKNSVVKDRVPDPNAIELGELCVGANSESPALFFKDNADNIIKIEPGAGAESSPTPPTDPGTGDLWFDTDNDTLNYWDGAAWVELGEAGDSPVKSVNTKTGAVVLNAADVGALAPGDDVSELTNDAGYLTSADVGEFWENDTSTSDIKNLDSITKVSVNGAVHTNATLDLNTGNFAIRLFPSSDQTGAYTAIGATGSYGTFSIGTAQVGVSNPWTSLVRFMVDANGKTIVGNDNGFGPPVAATDAELTVKGGVNSEFGTNAAQLGNVAPLNDWSCYPARPTTFYVAPPPSPTPTPEPVDPDFGVDVPTLSGGISSAGPMDIIELGDA